MGRRPQARNSPRRWADYAQDLPVKPRDDAATKNPVREQGPKPTTPVPKGPRF